MSPDAFINVEIDATFLNRLSNQFENALSRIDIIVDVCLCVWVEVPGFDPSQTSCCVDLLVHQLDVDEELTSFIGDICEVKAEFCEPDGGVDAGGNETSYHRHRFGHI